MAYEPGDCAPRKLKCLLALAFSGQFALGTEPSESWPRIQSEGFRGASSLSLSNWPSRHLRQHLIQLYAKRGYRFLEPIQHEGKDVSERGFEQAG